MIILYFVTSGNNTPLQEDEEDIHLNLHIDDYIEYYKNEYNFAVNIEKYQYQKYMLESLIEYMTKKIINDHC